VGADEMREIHEINVFGPVRMMRIFLPLLRRSATPRVVRGTSGMGSFTITFDLGRIESKIIGLSYPSSKAALNMITSQCAKAFPEFRSNAVDHSATPRPISTVTSASRPCSRAVTRSSGLPVVPWMAPRVL
jgi:NAD(P)-dependent dehydrogenase (short-subunit alcohol dehydrogenase family)